MPGTQWWNYEPVAIVYSETGPTELIRDPAAVNAGHRNIVRFLLNTDGGMFTAEQVMMGDADRFVIVLSLPAGGEC